MSGKMYRMFPIEIGRGCPYKCSYCSAPAYGDKYNGWRRIKCPNTVMTNIEDCVRGYGAEYLYFISETFLAAPNRWLEEFCDKYMDYRIPFWMNTRPETVTEERIDLLAKAGCHRISLGIEHGDKVFRQKMLNRFYSNEEVIKACKIIKDSGIELSVNNMVGFPDETEELFEQTVNLNRKVEADSHTISIFQPYWGTKLRDYCVLKEYILPYYICLNNFAESPLNMPQLPKEKIREFYLTFNERIK